MFRNLFAVLCIVLVLGAFLYAARPDWFAGLIASSKKQQEMVALKTTLILPAAGKGPPTCGDGTDVRRIVDLEEQGLPTRVNPYIMVLNTSDRTIRHYRLTTNVKTVALRSSNREVVVKGSNVLNPNGPLQLEVWMPSERELTFDVEFEIPKP
jgi:hypothetical protein